MSTPRLNLPIGDGTVTLRASEPEDNEVLVNGRDAVFHRFMGEGHPEPDPVACIIVEDVIVGWIDYDSPRPWLTDGEVNVGYNIFPEYRGRGYATRALELLLRLLQAQPAVHTATALVDPDNEASLRVVIRAGFTRHDDVDGERFYKRTTSDGADVAGAVSASADDDPARARTGGPGRDPDRRPAG